MPRLRLDTTAPLSSAPPCTASSNTASVHEPNLPDSHDQGSQNTFQSQENAPHTNPFDMAPPATEESQQSEPMEIIADGPTPPGDSSTEDPSQGGDGETMTHEPSARPATTPHLPPPHFPADSLLRAAHVLNRAREPTEIREGASADAHAGASCDAPLTDDAVGAASDEVANDAPSDDPVPASTDPRADESDGIGVSSTCERCEKTLTDAADVRPLVCIRCGDEHYLHYACLTRKERNKKRQWACAECWHDETRDLLRVKRTMRQERARAPSVHTAGASELPPAQNSGVHERRARATVSTGPPMTTEHECNREPENAVARVVMDPVPSATRRATVERESKKTKPASHTRPSDSTDEENQPLAVVREQLRERKRRDRMERERAAPLSDNSNATGGSRTRATPLPVGECSPERGRLGKAKQQRTAMSNAAAPVDDSVAPQGAIPQGAIPVDTGASASPPAPSVGARRQSGSSDPLVALAMQHAVPLDTVLNEATNTDDLPGFNDFLTTAPRNPLDALVDWLATLFTEEEWTCHTMLLVFTRPVSERYIFGILDVRDVNGEVQQRREHLHTLLSSKAHNALFYMLWAGPPLLVCRGKDRYLRA